MNSNEYFLFLLHRYLDDSITTAQKTVFFEMLRTNKYDGLLSSDILDQIYADSQDANIDLPKHSADALFETIITHRPRRTKPTYHAKWTRYIGGAAAAAALIFGAWLFYAQEDAGKARITADTATSDLEFHNLSDTIQQVILADNSVVTVYPNSTLTYPAQFADDTRKVSLIGKAFFDIAKDTIHPFIVNSENIVIRVLGTSFLINADSPLGVAEVEVRTGRVEVLKKTFKADDKGNTVVVTPNQKVVYTVKDDNLTKTLVDAPMQLIEAYSPRMKDLTPHTFIYKGQKLTAIFAELEKVYGIQIIVANKAVESCVFTGNLAGEDLFTKLQILGVATQTSYKTQGTDIIIDGKGCSN